MYTTFPELTGGVGGDALATLLILALSLLAAFIGSTVMRRMKDTTSASTAPQIMA